MVVEPSNTITQEIIKRIRLSLYEARLTGMKYMAGKINDEEFESQTAVQIDNMYRMFLLTNGEPTFEQEVI